MVIFLPTLAQGLLEQNACWSSLETGRLTIATEPVLAHAQGGGEKLTEDAVEDMLDKVVKLLAYISDKDLFAEFYRKRLSRRLLQDKSASDDHERAVLTRLKQQCGAQFTSKVRPPAQAHCFDVSEKIPLGVAVTNSETHSFISS